MKEIWNGKCASLSVYGYGALPYMGAVRIFVMRQSRYIRSFTDDESKMLICCFVLSSISYIQNCFFTVSAHIHGLDAVKLWIRCWKSCAMSLGRVRSRRHTVQGRNDSIQEFNEHSAFHLRYSFLTFTRQVALHHIHTTSSRTNYSF